MNKQFNIDIEQRQEELEYLKQTHREKQLFQSYARRVIENFKLYVKQMIKQYQFKDWPRRMQQIYNECFMETQSKIDQLTSSSIIGANLKQLKQDQLLEQWEKLSRAMITSELKSQRDVLAKKLLEVGKDFQNGMQDRNQAYLRIQNMNTLLINECNQMRDEKEKLREYLGIQKKAFRQVRRELVGKGFHGEYDEEVGKFLDNDDEEEDVDNVPGQENNNNNNQHTEEIHPQSPEIQKDGKNYFKKSRMLPFQEYHLKNQMLSSTSTNFSQNLSVEKNQEQLAVGDLLKQIQKMSDNPYGSLSNDLLREKVNNFLHSDIQKREESPLIKNNNSKSINSQSHNKHSNSVPYFNTNLMGNNSSQVMMGSSYQKEELQFPDTQKKQFPEIKAGPTPPATRNSQFSTGSNFMQTTTGTGFQVSGTQFGKKTFKQI